LQEEPRFHTYTAHNFPLPPIAGPQTVGPDAAAPPSTPLNTTLMSKRKMRPNAFSHTRTIVYKTLARLNYGDGDTVTPRNE